LALLVVLVGAGAWYWFGIKKPDAPQYRTATIEKGRLVASVSATGTLAPVISVQVGSQVSGQLKEVLVDFNSQVSKNQLIARIDPESFEYRVRQAQADLDAARAQVATQQANIAAQRAALSQVEVNLADARRDLERKEQLSDKKFLSPAEVDKSRAMVNSMVEQQKSAVAQVDVARANAGNAAAVVKQREAALSQARVDLDQQQVVGRALGDQRHQRRVAGVAAVPVGLAVDLDRLEHERQAGGGHDRDNGQLGLLEDAAPAGAHVGRGDKHLESGATVDPLEIDLGGQQVAQGIDVERI
jgi:multidrug efflux pump subunit AcrA (membrane-fusion protein)